MWLFKRCNKVGIILNKSNVQSLVRKKQPFTLPNRNRNISLELENHTLQRQGNGVLEDPFVDLFIRMWVTSISKPSIMAFIIKRLSHVTKLSA